LKKGIFFFFFGRCWEVGIEKDTRNKRNSTILLLAYRCEESRCSSFWQGGMIPLVGVTLYFFLSLALDCTLYCNHNVEERLVSVREARLSPPSMIDEKCKEGEELLVVLLVSVVVLDGEVKA